MPATTNVASTATFARQFTRIALGYTVFVVYGSLLPWQFRYRPFENALTGYLGLQASQGPSPSVSDMVTNVAVYWALAVFWMLGGVRPPGSGPTWQRAAALTLGCGGLSAAIEFAQLYVPQRTSSWFDWSANTLGAVLGVWVGAWLAVQVLPVLESASPARQFAPSEGRVRGRGMAWLWLAYLAAVVVANHWLSGDWLAWDAAAARWAETELLPFYYHQEASTAVALVSTLLTMLLYAPIGIFVRFAATRHRSSSLSAVLGGVLALLMACGRLFVPGQHLDLGDVFVAAVGSWFGYQALPLLVMAWQAVRPGSGSERAAALPAATTGDAGFAKGTLLARGLSIGLMGFVLVALLRFPVAPGLLALTYFGYAVALSRWPSLWLWVLPAVLPVLDLAPLSGRFFLDEFDLIVLLTLAVVTWPKTGVHRRPLAATGARWWVAFAVSVAVSTLIGLWPLQPLDVNAFASYLSHFNALRVAKGFAWAFALVLLLPRCGVAPEQAARRLGGGILAGLVGACALVVWERMAYPGLLNFSSQHRVGAFFSSMHNGGSHIEAYLAMAVPFLLLAIVQNARLALRLLGVALFVVATYAVMVTYARGGYVAYALAVSVAIATFWRQHRQQHVNNLGALTVVGILVSAGVAFAVGSGSFAQQRLATSETDLGVRDAHWHEALSIVDPGPVAAVFGMGLGRFPETYFFRNRDGQFLATFNYRRDSQGSHLTLGQGRPVYVEQFVDVRADRHYRLSLELRTAGQPVEFNVLLCARTYFASYGCESATFVSKAGDNGWHRHEAVIASGSLGQGPWWLRRPVKLSLENAASGTVVDVRRISLAEAAGANLVANGDFADGSDHWFFASNTNHLPWHIKNLAVGLLFDQGWLGLATFSLLLVSALRALARKAWVGEAHAAAALASAVGFLCVGMVDSLFDAPRLTTLFLLVLGVCGGLDWRSVAVAGGSRPAATDGPSTFQRRPVIARTAQEPKAASAPPSFRVALRTAGLAVIVTALTLAAITRLPGIPYNLRALPNPMHPWLSPLILAMALHWSLGMPALMARWLDTSRWSLPMLPVVLIVHAVAGWALMREAVLPGMIHKVAGSPVLDWPWDWETLLRYGALQATVLLLFTGGCLLVRIGARTASARSLLIWLVWSSVCLPVLHWGIVTMAATDNLVELMAGGGGRWSSSMLALWCVLIGSAGSALVEPLAGRRGALAVRLVWVVMSVPLGLSLLWLGLESSVAKYGTNFSALQFLLSASRQDYATGWQLSLRYLALHASLIALTALAQRSLHGLMQQARPLSNDLPVAK